MTRLTLDKARRASTSEASRHERVPYKRAATSYVRKGWRAIPVDGKQPGSTVPGVTGYQGEDPSPDHYREYVRRYGDNNIGVVMSTDVVAIDVDHGKKDGKDGVPTLARIALDGPEHFPPTYTNGHGDPTSLYRHFLYRVPDDVTPEEVASLAPGHDGIDVLRWMHRWARVSPSVHKSGEVYFWMDPKGEVCKAPKPSDLPQLTRVQWDWLVEVVGSSAKSNYRAADVDVDEWLAAHGDGTSEAVRTAVREHWGRADGLAGVERHGSHYSAMAACQMALAHLGEEGEPVETAIVWLRKQYVAYADGEGRDGIDEFERALATAIGKAVTKTEAGDRNGPVTLNGNEVDSFLARHTKNPARPMAREPIEEFSDVQVALRFKATNPGVVWADGVGWLRWNGKCWEHTGDAIVADLVRLFLIGWHRQEVLDGCDNARRTRLSALLSKPRQERIVRQLKVTDPIEARSLDQHPDLLNALNGVVDLRTGQLRPHDPALLLTKMTRAPYVPGARHDDWDKVKRALDPERLEYLLRRLGQALTGHVPTDDKVLFLTGVGGNGKSTLMDPVRIALGSYAALVPQSLLLAAGDRHPAELMTLAGVRLAVLEETPEEGRLNVPRLKAITGVETISARKMRQDFVEFPTQHALFVNTNYPPNVVETDHGTWRRLERVLFAQKFRDEASGIDKSLRQRVTQDIRVWMAVLGDLVARAQMYYADQRIMPEPPPGVMADTAAWRSDMDPLVEFFDTFLVGDPDAFVSSDELSEALNEFLTARNMREWNARTISTRITQHEGLPFKVEKSKARVSRKGYSPRRPFGSPSSSGPVAVWQGAAWA